MKERVFVSGGAGVVGSELVLKLRERGMEILVGDLKPRPPNWPADIQYRPGDLNYLTPEEIASFDPTVFVHLAATFERSTETYGFWEENFRHNVQLSNHLMGILRDSSSLRRVVFASSYLIYDQSMYSFPLPQSTPRILKETDPIYPRNLTGCAKLQHEIELDFLQGFRSQQFTSVCARIFRGYGKGSRCVISRWIRALLAGEPISVYKKEGKFDFVYAEEIAVGLLKLIDHSDITGVINLGNGRSRAVEEIVAILRQKFPNMVVEEYDEDIPFEASQADMTRFQTMTGWCPQRQLEDAIPEIIEFERNKRETVTSYGNVLITSISKKVPLIEQAKHGAQKLSPDIRVYGTDTDTNCIAGFFVDDFFPSIPSDSITFEHLVEKCRSANIKTIIPTRDGELLKYAAFRDRLHEVGIHVMVSSEETIRFCIDKLMFYRRCKERGIPAIPTSDSLDDIRTDRFVVKERHGAGSRTLRLDLRKEQAQDYAKELNDPVFQPFIEGDEFSCDAYVTRVGRIKGIVVRKRTLVISGESQITETVTIPDLEALVVELLSASEFYGHVIVQVLIDHKGAPHIVECNPRFGGASNLSVAKGLDTFYWVLLESNDADIENLPFRRVARELRQIRFPKDRVEVVK